MQGRCTGCRTGMYGGVCSQFYLHIRTGLCTGSDYQGNLQHAVAYEKPALIADKIDVQHTVSTKETENERS